MEAGRTVRKLVVRTNLSRIFKTERWEGCCNVKEWCEQKLKAIESDL